MACNTHRGMKTLYLLRHAKSSWKEPLDDRDRPLSPRGRRAAPAMAEYMKAEGLVPDRVLCSPAVRARATWAGMAPVLGSIPVSYHAVIYDAGSVGLLDLIHGVDDGQVSLLLVGHNPAIEELASRLVGRGPDELRDRLRRKYPTAALAALDLPVDHWREAAWGAATLVRFVRPKDLAVADDRGL
jgi:phosphohistidine phosphatase